MTDVAPSVETTEAAQDKLVALFVVEHVLDRRGSAVREGAS